MPVTFSEVRQRMAPVLAGSVVALMLLTGCQGSDDPVAPESPGEPSASASATPTPTAPATPEPSPASSLGPAANLPVPAKPALADENTAEGLEAFTEYWFELFSYGYATNDWTTFDSVTDPGCRTCANLTGQVRQVYSDGGWIEGGEVTLLSVQTEFVQNTSGSINSFVDVKQEELVYYDSEGDEIDRSSALEPTINVTIALWDVDKWIMLDFGSPEGT